MVKAAGSTEKFCAGKQVITISNGALHDGTAVKIEVAVRYHGQPRKGLPTRPRDRKLAECLTALYTAVGWNKSGWRTPSKNQRMLGDNGVHVAIWTDSGQLIGFARAPYDEYVAAVYDVICHPEYRMRGVATLAIQIVCEIYDQLGRGQSLVDGSGIPGFYEKLGFCPAPEERVMHRP